MTLLAAPHSARADLLTTLFWNRSVRRLVLLDGAGKPDSFAAPSADLDDAGHLDGTTGLVLADALVPRSSSATQYASQPGPRRPCGDRAARRSFRS